MTVLHKRELLFLLKSLELAIQNVNDQFSLEATWPTRKIWKACEKPKRAGEDPAAQTSVGDRQSSCYIKEMPKIAPMVFICRGSCCRSNRAKHGPFPPDKVGSHTQPTLLQEKLSYFPVWLAHVESKWQIKAQVIQEKSGALHE